jgi:hypothetical protein
MKKYVILTFEVKNVIEAEDWLNNKGRDGYKIINIHYHIISGTELVRYTLEIETR